MKECMFHNIIVTILFLSWKTTNSSSFDILKRIFTLITINFLTRCIWVLYVCKLYLLWHHLWTFLMYQVLLRKYLLLPLQLFKSIKFFLNYKIVWLSQITLTFDFPFVDVALNIMSLFFFLSFLSIHLLGGFLFWLWQAPPWPSKSTKWLYKTKCMG